MLNNKLTVDDNINAMYQRGNNRTTSGGYYMNPLVGLYHFPRGGVEGGKDFNYYKDNYQIQQCTITGILIRNLINQPIGILLHISTLRFIPVLVHYVTTGIKNLIIIFVVVQ